MLFDIAREAEDFPFDRDVVLKRRLNIKVGDTVAVKLANDIYKLLVVIQAIIFGKSGFENCKSLDICGSSVQCDETVKLLGVTFDYMLKFETHIANISKKAARQINVLFRLSNVLNLETVKLIYK